MIEILSDEDQNTTKLNQLKKIATDIFARHEVDFTTARRAGGWSNATWIAGGLVLRLAIQPERHTLLRESQLAALLPKEVGYPAIVETGETNGYEWILSKEIPGQSLGDIWGNLNEDERIAAIHQLWQKAQAVHHTNLSAAAALARDEAWFNNTDANKAESGLSHLVNLGLLTSPQVDVLRNALSHYWHALPGGACVLNHGDMTLDNVFWNDRQVTALLDLEFAVIAPVELDLNHLIKIGLSPTNEPARFYSPRIQHVIKDIATPIISHPGGKALLMGYAILLELWLLESWLAHPEGEGPLEEWDPYRRIQALAGGDNRYLAPIIGRP